MDRITRTHYAEPTQEQVDDEVLDLLHRLGMYRGNPDDPAERIRRDDLTSKVWLALPLRFQRIAREWAQA